MLTVWVRRTPHHAFCQEVLFGCFANFPFAFWSCLFIFCFRPLSLSFLPLSPIACLLFRCFLCLKSRCFYITKPFSLILRKCNYRQISPLMIFPCLLTSTGSVPNWTTSSSTLLSFLKTMAVIVPMKLKKTITAGINWRRTINAPMMMKIQRAIPCSLKVIDLANAGEVITVINPISSIQPLILFWFFSIISFLLFSSLTTVFLVSFDVTIKKTAKKLF